MRLLRATFVTLAILLGIYAIGCGGSDKKNPVNPGGGTADVTIRINGNLGSGSYTPSPDTVSVGQTVSWHNADTAAHTATDNNSGLAFGTGTISPGATSAPVAMNTAGSFPYHCTIHGLSMAGTLVVKP